MGRLGRRRRLGVVRQKCFPASSFILSATSEKRAPRHRRRQTEREGGPAYYIRYDTIQSDWDSEVIDSQLNRNEIKTEINELGFYL